MTWREGYEDWSDRQTAFSEMDFDAIFVFEQEKKAFLAGAKWAANDLIEKRVWESRDIVYELQKRLEEE